jgi:2-amino-4-hydroxy-6-hydroxymethyldihydropteridine diphosphokinase
MSGETAAYIGLGSNLGDREKNLNKALGLLAAERHINLFRTSSITETKPLADKKQRDYLNRVAEIKTTLKADKLLKVLKKIEAARLTSIYFCSAIKKSVRKTSLYRTDRCI